jgi:uncharacterized protein YutE (UPF0331/DUF86 family)
MFEGTEEIRGALLEAERLAVTGSARAGFLLSWASFEAAARSVHKKIFAKPQTPGRVITVLAERGYLLEHDASRLRHLARKRNAMVHGELDTKVTPDDVVFVVRSAERLLMKGHH